MNAPQRILVLGAGGRLGGALVRLYAARHQVIAAGRAEADLRRPEDLQALVARVQPSVVVNCAAMTNVDACETAREEAWQVNVDAAGVLARAARAEGARLVHISTDYVFSGQGRDLCTEDTPPAPLSWYGETKWRGEEAVLAASGQHAVVRVSWVFGPERPSFIDQLLLRAVRGEPLAAVDDKWSSPTFTDDAGQALEALFDPAVPGGIYHLCNHGVCTWKGWAEEALAAAESCGLVLRAREVAPLRIRDIPAFVAARPVYTPMDCRRLTALRGSSLRPWPEAVRDYVRAMVLAGRFTG